MQNAIINVNGQILNGESAKVSVFDRSFLYGDSLYEVVRTYEGRIFGLEEHLSRLEDSAKLCKMTLNQSASHYNEQIHSTLKAFHAQQGGYPGSKEGSRKKEAYIRLVVTRGVGKIGFGLSNLLTPTQYVIIVQPLEPPTRDAFEKGMKVQIAKRLRNDPRALDPAMKSGNYLNSLLAYLEAAEDGFEDSLMCNAEGHLTEGTTFNICYVNRGIVATPPLEIGILDGITRREVLEICRELGVPVREVRFPRERLYDAEEVFLTSSIREVFPITRVDDRIIADGKPGPITRKLAEAFNQRVRKRLGK